MAQVHLVRHTAVSPRWRGRCYGRSDVPLSRDGRQAARALAVDLAGLDADQVIASPLRRARLLAGRVARLKSVPLILEPRIAECHFGTWEGQTWEAIYRDTGDAMDGMIRAPDSFRPGGGETTCELAHRVYQWFDGLPRSSSLIVICHGGPIAALRGRRDGIAIEHWPRLVPSYGERVTIVR